MKEPSFFLKKCGLKIENEALITAIQAQALNSITKYKYLE